MITASATETRASDYFVSCIAFTSTNTSNQIEVTCICVVPLQKYMTTLGVSKIKIQESPDNESWSTKTTLYAEDYDEFLSYGTNYNRTHTVYTGRDGYYYRCIVTFYAADQYGSDSKIYTTNSTQV